MSSLRVPSSRACATRASKSSWVRMPIGPIAFQAGSPRSARRKSHAANASEAKKRMSLGARTPSLTRTCGTGSSPTFFIEPTRKGLEPNSSEWVSGKECRSCRSSGTPVTWSKQQSPMATARHPRFTALSEAPTNAAYAPLPAFSAAYQGSGRPRIFRFHNRRIASRSSKNSGPPERPRTKLSTNSAAQSAEKLLSVAPSATATRQRVGESEPRIAHASSYSVRAFPAFWHENASTENGAGVKLDGVSGRRGEVEVEDQRRPVVAAQRAERLRLLDWIAVGRLAVGDVDDDRGEALGVLGDPALDEVRSHLEGGAHRRAARVLGLEPERELHRLLHQPAVAVVGLLDAVLDAERVVGQLADRHQVLAGHCAVEGGLHHAVLAVPDHRHVEVVVDRIALGAADRQVVKQLVDDGRQLVGLAPIAAAAERIFHRGRLVQEEDETPRVLATDLSAVHAGSSSSPSWRV